MRKIKIMEHISLDGVIQHEVDDNFNYGGWTDPYRSVEGFEEVMEAQGDIFDLLLGRHTYDLWSAYWPHAGSGPMANNLNMAVKYVATHRPESLEWGPVSDLGKNIFDRLRTIKSTDGPDLVIWGSSTLTSPLVAQGFIDEIILMVYPVLLGKGKRFFSETVDAASLEFIKSKATPTGVLINSYRYVGPLLK